ncbi:MAG: hypothetical protein H6Q89_1281, partial [Myxococcaceae bacterium]|nr:hypothetical protein [Myxococcaceae bacterium]
AANQANADGLTDTFQNIEREAQRRAAERATSSPPDQPALLQRLEHGAGAGAVANPELRETNAQLRRRASPSDDRRQFFQFEIPPRSTALA